MPLSRWARFVAGSELYSHALLVPLICAYFIKLRWGQLSSSRAHQPVRLIFVAITVLSGCLLNSFFPFLATLSAQNYAALSASLFWLSLVCLCASKGGLENLRSLAFPLGFFCFIIPLPESVEGGVNFALQYGSAKVGLFLFQLVGTPVYTSDLIFKLPGISLQVAPECSGIHSSLALFIVSIVAGYLLLTAWPKRILLASVVLPLAALRNGFRIFVIGELCVHRGAEMIDSNIHHHGGPVFFILSLMPLTLTGWLLIRSERRISSQKHAR